MHVGGPHDWVWQVMKRAVFRGLRLELLDLLAYAPWKKNQKPALTVG